MQMDVVNNFASNIGITDYMKVGAGEPGPNNEPIQNLFFKGSAQDMTTPMAQGIMSVKDVPAFLQTTFQKYADARKIERSGDFDLFGNMFDLGTCTDGDIYFRTSSTPLSCSPAANPPSFSVDAR